LSRVGFDLTYYLDGGFDAWANAGNEVDTINTAVQFEQVKIGKKARSLMIQKETEYECRTRR
jgi:3-mercaptopyruvate sulfurtransferase SseA